MRRWAGGLAVLLLVAVATPLGSHGASAQMDGGRAAMTIEVRPRAGPPRATAGSAIRLRGMSFDENGRPVEIRWGGEDGVVLDTVTVDGRGEFLRVVTIPPDARVGPHLITATQRLLDDTSRDPSQVSIDVVATEAEATVVHEPPAATKTSPRWPVPVGLGLAALLTIGLVLSRRRRRTASPRS